MVTLPFFIPLTFPLSTVAILLSLLVHVAALVTFLGGRDGLLLLIIWKSNSSPALIVLGIFSLLPFNSSVR